MKSFQLSELQVLKRIQKRRRKLIRLYENVILKMETQLDKVNQMPGQRGVTALRETILSGPSESKKFLEKARKEARNVVAQLIKLKTN